MDIGDQEIEMKTSYLQFPFWKLDSTAKESVDEVKVDDSTIQALPHMITTCDDLITVPTVSPVSLDARRGLDDNSTRSRELALSRRQSSLDRLCSGGFCPRRCCSFGVALLLLL